MSTVTPIRTERQIIAQYADTISELTEERDQLQFASSIQTVICETLASEVTALYRRLATRNDQRRKRELVAYLVGVGCAAAALGAVYLLSSYDVARWLDGTLSALGWAA